ncbi:MAG TPA: AgmX/PglI C-terminal domain-containing protein [Myxococcaceae bacterium]
MNFTCDNCQRRYSIADEKVRGKTVKVRCKNCQNVISVQGPPAEMEESTRVVSLADVAKIREQELALQAAQPATRAPAGQSPWEEEPTRAAPARPASAPWYVMVKSKQEGPLDEAGLRGLVQSGAINARSFFWQQGMGDWKRGADIPELSGLFAAPAPPPAPPAPPMAPQLPDEPATVADRGQQHRGAQASNPRAQRQPEPEQDQAWEDQPTTVGPAAKLPAAREPWDLDPPATQQQAQHQESWDQPQAQQDQAWEDQQQQQQYDQPQDPAWDDQPQQQQHDQPQDPAWDDQPQEPRQSAKGNGNGQAGVGADLFSDLDLPAQNEQDHQDDQPAGQEAEQPDPLAQVKGKPGKDSKKGPVEDTRHFMVKSGVTRRNPFWKIALFILLPILLIAGGAFALDQLNFIPKAKVVNAQGQTVEKSYFSQEGVGELRDRLMGRKKPAPVTPAPVPTPAPAPKTPSDTAPKPEGQGGQAPAAPETGKSAEELKALYGDTTKTDVGPEARKDTEEVPVDAAASGGPAEEDVAKVVAQSQGAIKSCVEQELRKNPKFKGGKVTLVATVGTSGTVKSAKLDNKALDSAPVGTCIKKAATRMAFPAFKAEDGVEEVDLQIPLVLGSGAL